MKYIPKSLRQVERTIRPVMYGIGIAELNETFGMTHGPTADLEALLDEIGSNGSYIIRFDEDGSDDVIWKWVGDCWESIE